MQARGRGTKAAGALAGGQEAETPFQVSLIVPVQSEAGRIGRVLTGLSRLLRSTGWQAELIIVDDGSEDGSGEAATRWKSYFSEFGVVRHARRKGRGVAARTGALLARGRFVVLVDPRSDAPLQDSVHLIECLARGADVAVASRWLPGARALPAKSFLDRASETAFMALSRLMVPVGVRDSGAELVALRRNALRNIAQRARVTGEAFGHEWLALAGRLGFQVVEVPVSGAPKTEGEGRVRPNELAMLRDLWGLRRRLGREAAPRASDAHQLLKETGFVRLDRRKLFDTIAREPR